MVNQQAIPLEPLARCREQLKHLQASAIDVGALLRHLSRELADRGEAPSADSLDCLSQFKIEVEQLKSSVSANAPSSRINDAGLEGEPSLPRLQEEIDSLAVIQATLDKLDRIPMIRHLEQPEFAPWQRCLAEGTQLRNQLLAGPTHQARRQAEQFLAPQTPLNAIVTLIAEGSQLSDERWSMLLDAVSAEYGREVSTAIARGKLVMTPATQA